jgi:putative transcriptional regulator
MKLGRKTGKSDDPADVPGAESRSAGIEIGGGNGRGRSKDRDQETGRSYLDGQMLIAMPTMGDDRFTRSVIYICAHSSEGAMGIIVNQPASNISFRDLLVQLDVVGTTDLIELPPDAGGVKVLKGGPVETSRGFVLHSNDFFIENSTLPIDDGVCLTATLDILKAIARGTGPRSAVLALGYAGWAPGQLENEIHQNGWLHCAADAELIFGVDNDGKYEKALKKIGIDLGMLSSEAGHA